MSENAIRRILVGLDADGLADHALTQAMELADVLDARLDALHAVDIHPPFRGDAGAPRWAEAVARAMETARSTVEGRLELSVEHPRFAELPPSDYLGVAMGRPAAALLDFAEEHAVDLVVLGGHRHRKVFDFGGTARAVLAQSPCPVWVQPGAPRAIERILVAVDLAVGSERTLCTARTLARTLGARLGVLHCFLPPDFAYDEEHHVAAGPAYVVDSVRDDEREEFERRFAAFDWQGVAAESIFAEGSPAEEILAHQDRCELIVMGTHGRTGLARAVLGSEAYKVLRSAELPVVAVPLSAHALLEAAEA